MSILSYRSPPASVAVRPLVVPAPRPPAIEGLPSLVESDQHRNLIFNWLLAYSEYWKERWGNRRSAYISGNVTIYYRCPKTGQRLAIGPDFFVVLDVEDYPRSSWVVEHEGGRYPNFILEFLSDSTAKKDRNAKKALYQNVFKTPEYFWFHPITLELKGFRLSTTTGRYRAIRPDRQGRLWSEQLQVFIAVFEGKLRFFSPEGDLILFPLEQITAKKLEALRERMRRIDLEEQAAAERQAKEAERRAKEAERQAKEAERQAKEAAEQERDRERQAKEAERQAKEAAEQERDRERQAKEAERQAKEAALAEARRLADLLRQRGVDPDPPLGSEGSG